MCLISRGSEVRDAYNSLGWKVACHFQYFCLYVKFSFLLLMTQNNSVVGVVEQKQDLALLETV